jgi:hypothetical protein
LWTAGKKGICSPTEVYVMQEKVISNLEQATKEWLTAVLSHNGALTQGSVTAVTMNTGHGNWSESGSLQLAYSPDAQGERPSRLFLKLVNTDAGDGEFFLPSEVDYYLRDYLDVPDAPLLRCYDGRFSPQLQRYHLLLEDVSATHVVADDKAPTLAHGLALAEALAILHARWWGTDRLAEANAPSHDADHIRRFAAMAEPGVAHALTLFADDLKPHWPDFLRALFANLPERLVARAQDTANFTLIHGDPNTRNLMVPREGERPLYLIDKQPFDWSLTTWLGAFDLAYAIALYWESNLRRGLETAVLRHYHQTLLRRGVQGYSWEQLYEDYRMSVAMMVVVAVEYLRGGGDPRWRDFQRGLVQRTLTACDDLNCYELYA